MQLIHTIHLHGQEKSSEKVKEKCAFIEHSFLYTQNAQEVIPIQLVL